MGQGVAVLLDDPLELGAAEGLTSVRAQRFEGVFVNQSNGRAGGICFGLAQDAAGAADALNQVIAIAGFANQKIHILSCFVDLLEVVADVYGGCCQDERPVGSGLPRFFRLRASDAPQAAFANNAAQVGMSLVDAAQGVADDRAILPLVEPLAQVGLIGLYPIAQAIARQHECKRSKGRNGWQAGAFWRFVVGADVLPFVAKNLVEVGDDGRVGGGGEQADFAAGVVKVTHLLAEFEEEKKES